MRKRIITLLSVIILMTTLTSCGTSKSKLREQIQELKEENSSLEQKVDDLNEQLDIANLTISDYEQAQDSRGERLFIGTKFYSDGNYYKIDDDITVYNDCFCSEKYDVGNEDLKIVSQIIDDVELSNGITVYAVRSKDGIVWCSEYPRLEQISDD